MSGPGALDVLLSGERAGLDWGQYDSPDGEPNSWRFTGDFYRETEHVTRGVTLAQPAGEGPGLSSAFTDFSHGGFYDDDVKGMPMVSGSSGLDLPNWLSGGKLHGDIGEKIRCLGSGPPKFEEGDCPPSMPTDSYFKLEVTTVHVESVLAFQIGNELLEFLASKVISSVTKVNRKKFSIKADVFVESVMCTLKIRTYQQDGNKYAVEFQRRSGDCVTFNNAFQQALKFLKSRFPIASSSEQESRPDAFLMPPAPALRGDKAGFLPLLDMAGLVEFPGLQAECASALAQHMAQDGPLAASLCTERAFEEFKKLLQRDETDVAYPTARMLSLLVQLPEATHFFLETGLLPLIVEKVRSKTTSSLVQQELLQVLQAAMAGMPEAALNKIGSDISKILQVEGSLCPSGGLPS